MAAAAAMLMLAACSNTRVVTVSEWEAERMQARFAGEARLNAVGLPLLSQAVPLCADVGTTYGVWFTNSQAFRPFDRKAAETVLGTEDRLQAVWAAKRLPGTGGLMAGDLLERVGAIIAPRGERATQRWQTLVEGGLERNDTLEITVVRAGQEVPVTLFPTPVCLFRLVLWDNPAIFARTTGTEINVTTGLLRFARTDRELALVLGHEIAHNTAGHIRLPQVGDVAGPVTSALFDAVAELVGADVAGALSHTSAEPERTGVELDSIEQEMEADYLGLYLMAAAGFSIEGVDDVWRRLDAIVPDDTADPAYQANPTHPTNAARRTAFVAWIEEIRQKQAAGVPLRPEPQDWDRWLGEPGDGGASPPNAPAS